MTLGGQLRDDVLSRLWYVVALVVLFFVLLAGRLVYLQLIEGPRYRQFSGSHGIRTERIPAARGYIRDRHGMPLVWNAPAYRVTAIPQYLGNPVRVQASLETLLQVPGGVMARTLARRYVAPPYQPLILQSSASIDQVSRVLAWATPWPQSDDPFDLRGIGVQSWFTRSYFDVALAPHLFGYLKEIDPGELAARQTQFPGRYLRGDLIGAGGLEAQWDLPLRGIPGYKEHLVDARGFATASPDWLALSWERARRGATLHLALDARLQQAARDAMQGKHGAVVALDPRTGGVLVMMSEPGYDTAALAGPDRQSYWQTLVHDPAKPLFHRAVLGTYPPGSTYKIVMATAALAEAVVTPEEKVFCGGGLHFGGRRFGCWRRGGHGAIALREAIAQSCDVFFYQMGRRLGPDRIAKWAERFGLGARTGIDLPHESTGLIPTVAWKKKARGADWNPGETLSIAIGQGYDLVTPLQAAVMVATIANGGKRVRPYLVDTMTGTGATAIEHPDDAGEQVLDPAIVRLVHEGLVDVVEKGTGRRLAPLKLKIAGKTGTAQVVSLLRAQGIRSHGDHAWFVAYAPHDDPRIAVAVLVEHGGHGSSAAAPVAGEVIRTYLGAP